jgi:hypothetical protein
VSVLRSHSLCAIFCVWQAYVSAQFCGSRWVRVLFEPCVSVGMVRDYRIARGNFASLKLCIRAQLFICEQRFLRDGAISRTAVLVSGVKQEP